MQRLNQILSFSTKNHGLESSFNAYKWRINNSDIFNIFSFKPYGHLQIRGLKYVHPKNWIIEWKIRPGDQVMVLSGKYKGTVGQILQCDRMRNVVSVRGVKERTVQDSNGKSFKVPGTLHVSNVMLMDPTLGIPTRIAFQKDSNNHLVRVARKSGSILPMPDPSTIGYSKRRKSIEYLKGSNPIYESLNDLEHQSDTPLKDGIKDTPVEIATEKTYEYYEDMQSMETIRQMMTKYNYDLH